MMLQLPPSTGRKASIIIIWISIVTFFQGRLHHAVTAARVIRTTESSGVFFIAFSSISITLRSAASKPTVYMVVIAHQSWFHCKMASIITTWWTASTIYFSKRPLVQFPGTGVWMSPFVIPVVIEGIEFDVRAEVESYGAKGGKILFTDCVRSLIAKNHYGRKTRNWGSYGYPCCTISAVFILH